MESTKDLNYYKNNCKEDYINTPISVLRYITELEQALQLQQTGVIPRSIPDKLYILIQEKKDKRYFMFENIEGQANYSHGQCDTIEVIEDWLSKL